MRFFIRLKRNYIILAGLSIIIFYLFLAIMGIFWTPYDPTEMNYQEILKPPSFKHPLGTDEFGRDILSRIIWGSRISLLISFSASLIASFLGISIGVISGFWGGRLDNFLMRFIDVLFSFPPLLLAIFIMGILGEKTYNVIIAIGIVYIPQFARLVRAGVLSIKNLDFIQSAYAIGGGRFHILFKHVFPNIIVPIIVQMSLCLSLGILLESALSFLGLGVQPPYPSWGNMLSSARRFMIIAPWTAIFPGLAIVILVLGFNLFGDGLRDLLDPRLRNLK
ncbi:MAG: ABC transporter permease [Dictyoglomaceae bacterium]|nr:ABC transporter permease [Dictyoglomaceae bacterium]